MTLRDATDYALVAVLLVQAVLLMRERRRADDFEARAYETHLKLMRSVDALRRAERQP